MNALQNTPFYSTILSQIAWDAQHWQKVNKREKGDKNYPRVGVTVISIIPQVLNVQLWPKTTAQFYCAARLRSSTAQPHCAARTAQLDCAASRRSSNCAAPLRSSNCAVWLKMTRHFGAHARNYILKINADIYISGFETFAPSAENV